MRRSICTLTAAMVAAALSAGLALAAEDPAGTWYLSKMAEGSEEYNASLLHSLGMDGKLTLNEDGTAEMNISDSVGTGTWETHDDGLLITIEGSESEAVYVDDCIVLNQSGTTLFFSQEEPEIEDLDVGDVVSDPKLSDFDGEWEATHINMMGTNFPIDFLDMEILLSIKDGNVTFHQEEAGYESVEESEGIEAESEDLYAPEPIDFTKDGVFENGVLTVTADQLDKESLTLRLHESGKMTTGYPTEEVEQETEEEEIFVLGDTYIVFEKVD